MPWSDGSSTAPLPTRYRCIFRIGRLPRIEVKKVNMKHRTSLLADSALLIGCFLLVTPQPAQAYLDPGSGSMILQILAAGLVTASVVFRRSIARVLGFFRRDKGSPEK